jgi:anti-sigma factor ChrR (cupin superfamily)
MNCKELAYMLADYFDGSMDPRLREELDAHLAMCEPCKAFTNTYQAISDKTRVLRRHIEYEIPPEVRERLKTFVRSAALKYPEMVQAYRDQIERDRREQAADFAKAAAAGKLSSAAALLVESHCATCPGCGVFFTALRSAAPPAGGDLPGDVRSHVIALMQTFPPGDEFFLA